MIIKEMHNQEDKISLEDKEKQTIIEDKEKYKSKGKAKQTMVDQIEDDCLNFKNIQRASTI